MYRYPGGSLDVCVELLIQQIPNGGGHPLHILYLYVCTETPHVKGTGRSPHSGDPWETVSKRSKVEVAGLSF